jgi:arabinose-5-phosphate isomerase
MSLITNNNWDDNIIINIANQVFIDEIASLKAVQNNCIATDFTKAVKLLMSCQGKIVLMGIGKSGHIANKIAATLASTGSPAFFVHPSEALHGDLGMISDNDIIIAISYSGEANEFTSIIPILKRQNNKIIAITANSNSSLAKLSDIVLTIKIEKEACPLNLAPTSSTTATLVLGDALAICLLKIKGFNSNDFAKSHPGGNLGRQLTITNHDIMHTKNDIPIVYQDCNFKNIILEITAKRLGYTAVLDNMKELIGIITDGDIRRLLNKNDSFANLDLVKAIDIMTPKPKVVLDTQLAIESIKILEDLKITGILVINSKNELVGAIHLHDLFKAKIL